MSAIRFARSPKAHGWYYAEDANGTVYVIRQAEFSWVLEVDGASPTHHKSFKAAKEAAFSLSR